MSSNPLGPVIRPVSPVSQPVAPVLQFEGSSKKQQRERAAEVSRTLSRAGIDRDTLRDDWGVTLWRAFFKDKRAVLTFDAVGKGKVDFKGLEAWVQKRLKGAGFDSVKVLERSIKKCCDKACRSCLHGNKAARKDWTV